MNNIIGAGFVPCGACRAYVPRTCTHWKPAASIAAIRSHAARRRRRDEVQAARLEARKAARSANAARLLEQLGITRCAGTSVEGFPAACGDRKIHGMHPLKEES